MSDYAVAQLEEIEELDDGREPMRPVRHHFGIQAFGINTWTGRETGDRIINEHDEALGAEEELYFVHSGHARFELDGESVDAPVGSFVFVRPSVKRTAFAEEPNTTLVALGGVPGKAYEPAGWEIWAPLNPLYQAGRYDEAADRGKALLEEHPEYRALAYNVACVESLAGRKEEAIEHLRLAVEGEGSERLRELVATDTDLDPIRDEPKFKELVG